MNQKANEKRRAIYTFGGNTRLLETLLDLKCRFLIIGGVAVSFYCPDRIPDDLDILISKNPDEAESISVALTRLGFDLVPIDRLAKDGVRISLNSAEFYAELLTPKSGMDFDGLWGRRQYAVLNGLSVPVISLDDLIELKRMAIESMDEGHDKHQADLVLLCRLEGR